jgi:hypothetical protein
MMFVRFEKKMVVDTNTNDELDPARLEDGPVLGQ